MVIAGGFLGWVLARWVPALRTLQAHGGDDDGRPPLISDDALHTDKPSTGRAVRIIAIGLTLFVPVLLVTLLFGSDSVFATQGLFFSGAAVVTFGGAYAVLAYVAQQAVEVYGWLAPGEMVHGLALAETTRAR